MASPFIFARELAALVMPMMFHPTPPPHAPENGAPAPGWQRAVEIEMRTDNGIDPPAMLPCLEFDGIPWCLDPSSTAADICARTYTCTISARFPDTAAAFTLYLIDTAQDGQRQSLGRWHCILNEPCTYQAEAETPAPPLALAISLRVWDDRAN